MGSVYGGGLMPPILGLAATCDCLNNTSVCNNATLMQGIIDNTSACVNLAVQHPTTWHVAAVLPLVAGGFMLSNTSIRMMRLWGMELFDWFRRR